MISTVRLLQVLAVSIVSIVLAGAVKKDLSAQDVTAVRVDNLESRVGSLEAMHLEGQLAKLTTIIETDHALLMAIAGAVALMGIETALRFFNKKGSSAKAGP